MMQIIFLEWLNAFDLHVANCKALLVFDNYSAHVPLEELPARIQLRNTRVLYLPPNMMSKIQPCDAGIIRNFKAYYRHRFNRLLLQRLEDGVDQVEKIDMLQAIWLTVPVWATNVKIVTIQNCYRHCQIRTTKGPRQAAPTEEDLIDKDVIDKLESQITRLRYKTPMDIKSLLTYPDEDIVSYISTIDEIIDGHLPHLEGTQADDADKEDDSQKVTPMSTKEASNMLQSLESFWLQQDGDNAVFISSLRCMQEKVSMFMTHQMVQKSINDFFQLVQGGLQRFCSFCFGVLQGVLNYKIFGTAKSY